MQVLFLMWLLMAGMKDVLWGTEREGGEGQPTRTTEVDAAEGPVGPPPPKP